MFKAVCRIPCCSPIDSTGAAWRRASIPRQNVCRTSSSGPGERRKGGLCVCCLALLIGEMSRTWRALLSGFTWAARGAWALVTALRCCTQGLGTLTSSLCWGNCNCLQTVATALKWTWWRCVPCCKELQQKCFFHTLAGWRFLHSIMSSPDLLAGMECGRKRRAVCFRKANQINSAYMLNRKNFLKNLLLNLKAKF